MYLIKTPYWIQRTLPRFTWRISTQERVLYLTFDDGPIPNVTPWVLAQLRAYNAKATFFCVGANVERHPTIFQQILSEGHRVGNHTYNHLNGWKTSNTTYFDNIAACAEQVDSSLFRPPYGKLSPKQARVLGRDYNIILWDVISGDFDTNLSKTACWEGVQKHSTAGSIVVFHDSLKAESSLRFVLPKTLAYFAKANYRFEVLPSEK